MLAWECLWLMWKRGAAAAEVSCARCVASRQTYFFALDFAPFSHFSSSACALTASAAACLLAAASAFFALPAAFFVFSPAFLGAIVACRERWIVRVVK